MSLRKLSWFLHICLMKEWQANYEHTCGIHENKWDFADPINCVRSSPNATSLTGCLTDLAIDSLLGKMQCFWEMWGYCWCLCTSDSTRSFCNIFGLLRFVLRRTEMNSKKESVLAYSVVPLQSRWVFPAERRSCKGCRPLIRGWVGARRRRR